MFDYGAFLPCVYTGSDVTALDIQAVPWPEKKLWTLAFEQGEDGTGKVMRGMRTAKRKTRRSSSSPVRLARPAAAA